MGIPVWVSRDIVVALDDCQTIPAQTVDQSQQSSPSQSSQTTTGVSSAESILQSLNEPTKPAGRHVSAMPDPQNLKNPVVTTQQTSNADNVTPAQNEIARTASHIVYACGSTQADWMIIGESPELNDDQNNQPYSGDSGVLLENMLRAVGIDKPRKDAYMINIIKASMQAIVPESVGELNQILGQKIKEIQPKIILIVGQLSAQNILQSKEPLARLRGKAQIHPETGTNIVVTYYPTHLLSKPIDKRKAWEDLKLAKKIIGDASE